MGKRKLSEVTKQRIRETFKRKGLRPPHRKGYHLSKETKIKISKANMGFKNPNWRGGINPLYLQIRRCFKYRQWRSDVFTRDNFTCQKCGDKIGGNLSSHHLKPFIDILEEYNIKTLNEAENCEELWNINNGITLCGNCHKKTNNFGRRKNTV